MKTLTVEKLKTCAFSQQCHINGGDAYSITIETNEEYGLSINAITDGSPNYKIKKKELCLTDDSNIYISLLVKSPNFKGFVKKYNAYYAEVAAIVDSVKS